MSATFPQVASEDFIRAVLERCPAGLLVVDDSGKIVALNLEIERQFGYARDELLGQSVEMLVPGELAAGHEKLRSLYSAMPASRRMGTGRDLFGRHKDGRKIPLEIGLSAVSTQEGSFIVATIADLRERRQQESRDQQPHKLDAMSSLASGIAHDFNNILLGIMGYTELARAAVTDRATAVADLDVVLDTVRRGRELIGRILVITRGTDPVRVDTDCAATVRDAIQLLRPSLPSNLEIRESYDPSTPHVLSDNDEIGQIVTNLASNAARAMQSCGGVLDIRLEPVSVDKVFIADHPGMREGLHAHLSVSDTGSGIHAEDLGHIYEPFFSTKPRGEGAGLGLAVVDRIVQSLGGTVEVKSSVGEGTRFDVYLPSVAVDRSRRDVRSAHRNILLVDDEGSLARLGQRVLEAAGFEVTAHTSALHALESFRLHPRHFDLLITDNGMPNMTGLELVQQVLAISPNTPVLLVSGVGESMSEEELKMRGVTQLLPKPYESAALVGTVQEIFETSRSR